MWRYIQRVLIKLGVSMRKALCVFLTLVFSSHAVADSLANGGEVLELFSVSTLVGSGNTTKDESFVVKISGDCIDGWDHNRSLNGYFIVKSNLLSTLSIYKNI
jgi:hypothetical protein